MKNFYDKLLSFVTPAIKFVGKFGLPERKITGKFYYENRDKIEVGTVLLTKTDYEFSNLINPTDLKHAGIYVGGIGQGKTKYVLEATGKGVVLTDLVSFLTTKDLVVGCKPTFIRNPDEFKAELLEAAQRYEGIPYDYLFNKDGKAFYCFELVATCFKDVYSEIQFKCKEIVKGKKIFSEDTFLDPDFFEIIFDSRK